MTPAALIAWLGTSPALDPHAKAVVLALAAHVDSEGVARVSMPRLAVCTGCHERTVEARLSALVDGRFVEVAAAEPGRPKGYRLTLNQGQTPPIPLGGSSLNPPHPIGGVVESNPPTPMGGVVVEPPHSHGGGYPPNAIGGVSHKPLTSKGSDRTKPRAKRESPPISVLPLADHDQDQPQIEGAKRRRTVAQAPPTEVETVAIFVALGVPDGRARTMAAKCWSYWSGQGWRRRSGPILDWRATCRTWVLNEGERDPQLLAAVQAMLPLPDAKTRVLPGKSSQDDAHDWDPEDGTDPARAALWVEYQNALGLEALMRVRRNRRYPTIDELRAWKARTTATTP